LYDTDPVKALNRASGHPPPITKFCIPTWDPSEFEMPRRRPDHTDR
jgi:hypothetical protein